MRADFTATHVVTTKHLLTLPDTISERSSTPQTWSSPSLASSRRLRPRWTRSAQTLLTSCCAVADHRAGQGRAQSIRQEHAGQRARDGEVCAVRAGQQRWRSGVRRHGGVSLNPQPLSLHVWRSCTYATRALKHGERRGSGG